MLSTLPQHVLGKQTAALVWGKRSWGCWYQLPKPCSGKQSMNNMLTTKCFQIYPHLLKSMHFINSYILFLHYAYTSLVIYPSTYLRTVINVMHYLTKPTQEPRHPPAGHGIPLGLLQQSPVPAPAGSGQNNTQGGVLWAPLQGSAAEAGPRCAHMRQDSPHSQDSPLWCNSLS